MQQSFLSISPSAANEKVLRIHYMEEKPENAKELIIFLHGFSQFWYAWKPYLEYFSNKGFHVVAPDMRGFNDSDKPDATASYDMKYLMSDILELMHHCGYSKAIIIGHDWGGSVVWELAEHHPEKIEAAIVVNSPHRGAYAANIRKKPLLNLSQTLRSRRMLLVMKTLSVIRWHYKSPVLLQARSTTTVPIHLVNSAWV